MPALSVSTPFHPVWAYLNSALADDGARQFFACRGLRPSDRKTRTHEQIEALAARFPYTRIPLMMEFCQRYYQPLPLHRFLTELGTLLSDLFAPDGCLTLLADSEQLGHVLKTQGAGTQQLIVYQEFTNWYMASIQTIRVVSPGAVSFSPARSVADLFDALTSYAIEANCLTANLYSRRNKVWYGFVTYIQQKYAVNLLPPSSDVREALALQAKATPLYTLVERPPQYATWGFRKKFLWDFENNEEFRLQLLRKDLEMSTAWENSGHDIEDFADWIKERVP